MITSALSRKRNANDTKARILEAAKLAFTNLGYTQAGLREIAAIAGVNSALLVRYFGSKAGLFEAALVDGINIEALLDDGRAGFGQRLARHFLDETLNAKPPAMIGVPASDEIGITIVARVTEEHAVAPLAEWLGPPDARARAMQIVMLAVAFATYVRHSAFGPAQTSIDRAMIDWFAGSVQAIVDRKPSSNDQ